MRLWHYELISSLPRLQLLGQHRELCALRGKSWGKKHSTVNYVFRHKWEILINYHIKIMDEMKNRGYRPNKIWYDFYYRGKRTDPIDPSWVTKLGANEMYPEHTDEYKHSCLKNLWKKITKAPPQKYPDNEVYRVFTLIQQEKISI